VKIYTNGNYDILGFVFRRRILGICIRSEFDYVIKPLSLVSLPLYHLKADAKPQFVPKRSRYDEP